MKVGNITHVEMAFSYKGQRFSDDKFLLCVRDERYEYNVQTIVMFENRTFVDLDEYEFDNNLYATRPPFNNPYNIADLPLSRFYVNQLIKIDSGTIIENSGAESPYLPKVRTFNENVNSFDENKIFEFFEGSIDQNKSLFTPESSIIFDLIKNVYLETPNSFFVISAERLLGPFVALKINELSFNIIKGNALKFGEYYLNEDAFIEFEANKVTRKIYLESTNLQLSYKSDYLFVSDEELMKLFENELINYPELFDEKSLSNIMKVIVKSAELPAMTDNAESNVRLQNILRQGQHQLIKNIDLINLIPDVKKIKDDKEKIGEELFVLNQEYVALTNVKKNIVEEIADLDEIKKVQLQKHKDDFQNDIDGLELKRNNLVVEVSQKKVELEKHLESTLKDIEFYERTKSELNQQIGNLREDFKEEQKNAQLSLQNLIKSKLHFDFISGRDFSDNDQIAFEGLDYTVEDDFGTNQYREFRNELMNTLKQCNRNFETHFIDNLLISIFQNKLTILAGVPGTGKTTLARLIANILAPKEKVREVAVNRGWTSQKDLVGFVNPLSKKFHSSSTDIYTLLNQMNYESVDEKKYLNTSLSYIILDEANLSPLEHYWSSFYNLTDSNGMLEIKLGNEENIKYPNNLRFIGTINYDHTTEELSPRVLDRVNIIQLPRPDDINFNMLDIREVKKINLTFKRAMEFFELGATANQEFKLDEKIEKSFKEIKGEFANLNIMISPRVEIAIKRYILLAKKYMSDVNKPLDYSVTQRMLPLINLHGSENKQKLENLKEKLRSNKLEISANTVENIIKIASEKGIYEDNFNYFLTLSNV